MPKRDDDEITSLLLSWRSGDKDALDRLMPLVFQQLKEIAGHLMRRERPDHTLQTTALVNEAYLRLADLASINWKDRAHFAAMSAKIMRRVLVDHARAHLRDKRGGSAKRAEDVDLLSLPGDRASNLVELDEALKELARHDLQLARVVELRFFGGLDRDAIAEVLGISSATVTRRWRAARAWLIRYMRRPPA